MRIRILVVVTILACSLRGLAGAQEDQAFAELFGKDVDGVAATPSKKDDVELAGKLLVAAKDLKSNSKLRALLLRKSHDLGSKDPTGYATAIAALELFAADNPDRLETCTDAIIVLQEKLYHAARTADRRPQAEALAARLIASSKQKATAKKSGEAVALLRKALGLAGIAGSETGGVIQDQIKSLGDRQQAEKKAAELYDRLFKDRNDRESLASLIRLLLVELDRPADALKLAPEVKDDSLTRLLAALARPSDTWTADEAGAIASWFEAQSAEATPSGQRLALEKASAAAARQLDAYQDDDLGRLKIKVTTERLAKALESLDAKTTVAAKARRPRAKYIPGLVARLYPRHRSQEDGNLYTGWVPPDELGDPIGRPQLIATVSPLKYPPTNNVVATGYLKIDEPGEYAFNAIAGHDRCALYLNGELVCPFRDGEDKIVRVTLEKGMIPFQLAGMVVPDGQCSVRWQPPGATELSPIPTAVLFCTVE